MSTFSPAPRPTHSPWGTPDNAEQILPGIWSVDTPSHGGLILTEERQAAMPPALAREGGAFEEDCDWALVVLAFEPEFARTAMGTKGWLQLAHDTVKCWQPDAYTAFTGKAVPPNESYILRRRAAYRERIGKICVTAAWGDWADWVPAGKVGVTGQRLLDVDHLGRPSYAGKTFRGLCDKHRYNAALVNTFDELDVELIPTPEPVPCRPPAISPSNGSAHPRTPTASPASPQCWTRPTRCGGDTIFTASTAYGARLSWADCASKSATASIS